MYDMRRLPDPQGKTIKECLGVYYENGSSGLPETMKEKKRVITYVIE